MTTLKDMKLSMATAMDRNSKKWKNREVTWEWFVDRTAKTQRTSETVLEYTKLAKTKQDEIKDVGGFVAGHLTGGRRKNGSVLHRSCVTLDVDHCGPDWLGTDFALTNPYAAVVYSTHKHTPDNPRLRIILPLNRPVSAEEYEPIARKLADGWGIEVFDPTTYQPARLMYWPSTSVDGVFVHEVFDGEVVDADLILKQFKDWRDVSEWPFAKKENERIVRSSKKQGDPLEKPGFIGTFNRTYLISDAIEKFLGDAYDRTDKPDRFTYKNGSTAGGLVIYDEKFAYSYHGTDPVSGRLVNAFDLVRIHKFGILDEDVELDTPVNKLPSYKSMVDFASEDVEVRHTRAMELAGEFDVYPQADQDLAVDSDGELVPAVKKPVNTDWMKSLEMSGNDIKPSLNNLKLILENDPVVGGVIGFDDFEKMTVLIRSVPWRETPIGDHYLTARDIDHLEHYIETTYKVSAARLKKALSLIEERSKFNPVREMLDALTWDGVPRVERLLIDFLGADDNAYTRTVTRKTLTAAVARIYNPGCKFDYVLTFVGKQGLKKSTLMERLGGRWFSDTFSFAMMADKKSGFEQIQGVWICEIPEMSGLMRTEVEAVKKFISSKKDRYRPAYGTTTMTYKRTCIFIGSTNRTDFLRDQTGNRRFWPVEAQEKRIVKDVYKDLTDHEVMQMWAEAKHYFQKGETLYLDKEMEESATLMQDRHSEVHPWASTIEEYLDTEIPVGVWSKMNRYDRAAWVRGDREGLVEPDTKTKPRTKVTIDEIWQEALNQNNLIGEREAYQIKAIMAKIKGWGMASGIVKTHTGKVVRNAFTRAEIVEELDLLS